MTGKLRLGPLPNQEAVKTTIMLSAALREELDDYAHLHAQAWGKTPDIASLIPHMLAAFIARDREFRRLRAGLKKTGGGSSTTDGVQARTRSAAE